MLDYSAGVARTLDCFLQHDTKKAFLLKGRWGVGKTYFWKSYINERLCQTSPIRESKYAYVSLFGLDSIESVEQLIFAQTVIVKPNNELVRKGNSLRKITPWIEAIPGLDKIAGIINRLGVMFIKDTLVCFDDLERLGVGLPLAEVFGFMATLKEQNNCRIVILSNDDEISGDNRTAFVHYHEKVIDQTAPFSPPPNECAQIVFSGCEDINHLAQILVRLPLSNIRIIRLAAWLMEDVTPLLNDRLPETIRIVREHILMLTAFARDKSFQIDVNRVASWSIADVYLEDNSSDEASTLSKRLLELGYVHSEVDNLIIALIHDGICNTEAFSRELDNIDSQFRRHEVTAQLNAAWSQFNGNFVADTEQVLTAFGKLLDMHAGHLSAHDYDQCIRVVVKLGGVIEPQWQDSYITCNIDSADLKGLSAFEKQTKTSSILKRIQARRETLQGGMTIYGTIKSIVEQSGWNPDMVEFLKDKPLEEYKREFLASTDKDLLHNLFGFARLWGRTEKEDERSIAQKMAAALDLIAKDSELNSMRVQGILDQISPAIK